MTATLSPPMFLQFQNPNNSGSPAVGFKLFTYQAGTSVKQSTWTDSTQTVQNANPLPLDGNGVAAGGASAAVWGDPSLTYKFVWAPANDTDPPSSPIRTIDNIAFPVSLGFLQVLTSQPVLASYARTAAEIAAGVTPVNYAYAPGYVERYGAVGDGVTNDTAAFARAVSVAVNGGGSIYLNSKTYLATMSIRGNNINIIGPGSAFCTIKNPPGALSLGGVVEVGDTASGNSATAYDKFTARGFTIDGNRANATAPTDDLKGHGMPFTKITHFDIRDIRAINCWNAGVGIFINSNYGIVDCYVENCGNASLTAPGFDINSSKYIHARVVSNACQQGARNLDNTQGNILNITVLNATVAGFTDGNQTVNQSFDNQITVAVYGAGGDGVQIGNNCRSTQYRISCYGCTGNGVQEVYFATASQRPSGNRYDVVTQNNGLNSVIIGGDGSIWNVSSYQDGRTGGAGSSYAVQVDGQRNTISANITDSATPQVRGINLTANSASNNLISFVRNTLVSEYADSGTSNRFTARILRGSKTYDAPNLAAGAQTSTTVTVTGATTASGDIADVRYSNNIGGIVIYAEVTAADTVTAWLTNETAGAIDLASATIYAVVTKATP